MLLGRERELGCLDAVLDGARSGSTGVLSFVGGPGVGKTTLCAEAAARARGFRVVSITAAHAESGLPLAVAADLARILHDSRRPVPDHAEATLAALRGGRPLGPGDRLALGVAALFLHAAASEDEPLLVVIDDVQWADGASLDALTFAWRRLQHDRVAVVLATRFPVPRMIESISHVVQIDGLGLESGIELIESICPNSVQVAVARELILRTGGNPLALGEIVGALSAAELSGSDPLPEPLPNSPRLTFSFSSAIEGLQPSARFALAVVAAGGSGASIYTSAALHALDAGADDLGPALASGLCHFAGDRYEIRHPLIATAATAAMSDHEVRRIHGALADVTRASDPVRSALHLERSAHGPSESIAVALVEAAARVRAHGGPMASAPVVASAARLTPAGPLRSERMVAAIGEALAGGHLDLVVRLSAQIRAEPGPAAAIATATILEGQASTWLGASDRIIDELWALSTDAHHAPSALHTIMPLLTNRGEFDRLAGAMSLLRAHLEVGPSPPLSAMADLTDAVLGTRRTDSIVAAADELLHCPPSDREGLLQCGFVALACAYSEHHWQSVKLAAQAIHGLRAGGAVTDLPFVLNVAGQSAWWIGDWARAGAHFDEALSLASDTRQPAMEGVGHGLLARVAAATGDLKGTEHHSERALDCAVTYRSLPCEAYAHHARALLAVGRGDYRSALEPLRRVHTMLHPSSGACSPMLAPYAADLIEALICTDHIDEAVEQIVLLRDVARVQTSPWAATVATRCEALLPGSEWESLFRQALEATGEGLEFEQARAALGFGERLRRERRPRDAAVQLDRAHSRFSRLGASVWARRAAAELRALGIGVERPAASPDALTPQELRVCMLVAEGASNRAAATALLLSPKTVETHLGRAFRKLNVTSRVQLARLMSASDELRTGN